MININSLDALKSWLKSTCSNEPPGNRTFEDGKLKIEFDPIRAVFIVAGTDKIFFQERIRQALDNEDKLNRLARDMLTIEIN